MSLNGPDDPAARDMNRFYDLPGAADHVIEQFARNWPGWTLRREDGRWFAASASGTEIFSYWYTDLEQHLAALDWESRRRWSR